MSSTQDHRDEALRRLNGKVSEPERKKENREASVTGSSSQGSAAQSVGPSQMGWTGKASSVNTKQTGTSSKR